MNKVWISCPIFTVQVDLDSDDIIRAAAPIVKRFIGQSFYDLTRWAYSKGHTKVYWF